MDIKAFKRPHWEPLPHEGCHGVDCRVIFVENDLALSLLRFARHATIHEHPAPFRIDVACLEGRGWMRIGSEETEFASGQWARWPPGVPHCLWTDDSTMITLMIEHPERR